MYDYKWEVRFLKLAQHFSTWSKDPSTKVGAVIVDPDRIIRGTGYNGFPRGVKDRKERYEDRNTKYALVEHAERNAIYNSYGSLKGCTIYVYPTIMVPACCTDCTKAIIQTGIKRVVQWDGETAERWKEAASFSELMLHEAGVIVSKIPEEYGWLDYDKNNRKEIEKSQVDFFEKLKDDAQ